MPTPAARAYFDHAATTPMLPEAVAAMLPFLTDRHDNPSSPHAGGRAARRAIDDARDELAALLGGGPGELVLTSGGTEADNLALAGVRGTVVVSAVEHHAVLEPARRLGGRLAPVDDCGRIDLAALASLLDPSVELVSVMAVNNEVGVVQPLAEVAALVRDRAPNALLHSDAVQAVPWRDLERDVADFDLVSVSAHKFGGPKGVGALLVRPPARARLAPMLIGGAQESELRAGTENVAGIVGAGAAAASWRAGRPAIAARVARLAERLEAGLRAGGAVPTVPSELRVAAFVPMRFSGVSTEELLIVLDEEGVAASAGAACASGALEPSHVLLAMGLSPDEIEGAIRISLGWSSTDADVDLCLEAVPRALQRLRTGGASA